MTPNRIPTFLSSPVLFILQIRDTFFLLGKGASATQKKFGRLHDLVGRNMHELFTAAAKWGEEKRKRLLQSTHEEKRTTYRAFPYKFGKNKESSFVVVFLLFLFPKLPQKSDKTLFFFGPIFSTPHWTLARLLSFLPSVRTAIWSSSFLSGRFGKHKDRSSFFPLSGHSAFPPLLSLISFGKPRCVFRLCMSWVEREAISSFFHFPPQKRRKKENTFLSPWQICEKGKSVWKIWRKEKERRHFSSFLFENWWSNHDGRKKRRRMQFPEILIFIKRHFK